MSERLNKVRVEESLPNERLDIYLRDFFPSMSRGAFQRLINDGNILVDGVAVKPTHPPREGEVITISWPDAKPMEAKAEEIPLEILHEDDDLLVLNKAAGIVVHPAVGHNEHTLVNALLHHCAGRLSGIGGVLRPGIVHRLDKDTSGCLVIAKNDAAHIGLAEQFELRETRKTYLALLCGTLRSPAGEIRGAIARHPLQRKKMAITRTGGKEARTSYRILEQFAMATLVEATLHTGRTHQIRVHFQSLGNPLVGDLTYGEKQNANLARSKFGVKAERQMLHSHRLGFTHPATGLPMDFEAPPPADFEAALEVLRGR